MLRKILKWVAWGFIAAVLFLGPIAGIWQSKKFEYCYSHEGQYPTSQNEPDKPTAVLVPVTGAALVWRCVGGFANDNGVAITALATVLLTIVTGGLVISAFVNTRPFARNCAPTYSRRTV